MSNKIVELRGEITCRWFINSLASTGGFSAIASTNGFSDNCKHSSLVA